MAEVDRIMSVRWRWGPADCCASACDVFAALRGIDPMAPVRGRYDSAASAVRLIRRMGGFVAMAQGLATRAGLTACGPVPGAIGLSHAGAAHGPEGRALLICVQPGYWAGKNELGYSIIPDAEMCWNV